MQNSCPPPEDALVRALKNFHKHHIFHYYHDILPEVVFCDIQVLLDKVTELVEYAALLREDSDPIAGLGEWSKFKKMGQFKADLLDHDKLKKHLFIFWLEILEARSTKQLN